MSKVIPVISTDGYLSADKEFLGWDVSRFDTTSVQVEVTNTDGYSLVSGTVKLQVSNDNPVLNRPEYVNSNSWTDVTGATYTITQATTDNVVFNLINHGYKWLRVVFTYTSGGAPVTIRVQNKRQ